MEAGGRPEAGQRAAAKAVGRLELDALLDDGVAAAAVEQRLLDAREPAAQRADGEVVRGRAPDGDRLRPRRLADPALNVARSPPQRGSSPAAEVPIQVVAAPGALPRALEQRREERMNDRDRLDQLHRLLDRLERMPASADRDWMLAEARGRAVDVETGFAPAPMRALPRDELEAQLAAERSPRPAPVKPHRRQPSRDTQHGRLGRPPVRMAPLASPERGREEVVDLLGQGGVMCLDDAPAAATDASRGWAGGLRG